jgi:hypothetical protein
MAYHYSVRECDLIFASLSHNTWNLPVSNIVRSLQEGDVKNNPDMPGNRAV